MADDTYVIDALVTSPGTVFVTDDGLGVDWLVFRGVFRQPTEINLGWTTQNGVATSALGSYFGSSISANRLIVNGVIENARGSRGSDLITGNFTSNLLYGDASATSAGRADTISGMGGLDRIFGGAGNDRIFGGDASDDLHGDAGNDTIFGGEGTDIVEGGDGADSLFGGTETSDILSYAGSTAGVRVSLTAGTTTTGIGGDANGDRINGFERIIGSDYNDLLVDTIDETLAAFGNRNEFWGGGGPDTLKLNGGDDSGYGGAGNDRIFGGLGRDSLAGDDDADRLTGGQGADTLRGGDGADRFVFLAAGDSTVLSTGRDIIEDFSRPEKDKIDLSAMDAIAGGANDSFTFIGFASFSALGQLRLFDTGTGIIVQGNVSGSVAADFAILVEDVADLISTDFVL